MVDDALDDLCVLQDYASNRQNIFKYTLNVDNGFEMEYNREYDISEVMSGV